MRNDAKVACDVDLHTNLELALGTMFKSSHNVAWIECAGLKGLKDLNWIDTFPALLVCGKHVCGLDIQSTCIIVYNEEKILRAKYANVCRGTAIDKTTLL